MKKMPLIELDSTKFWNAYVEYCNTYINISFEDKNQFLSLRKSSEFIDKYFSKDQFLNILKNNYIRKNEQNKIYIRDLEFLKKFIVVYYALESNNFIKKTLEYNGQNLMRVFAPKKTYKQENINNDKNIQIIFKFFATPEFKNFIKIYKNNLYEIKN